MDLRVVYENIPPGSIAGSTSTATYKQSFVNMADFKTRRTVPKYATLEKNFWKLDGTFENFPNTPKKLGYISTIMSDENGQFSNTILITRRYDANYTAPRFND